MDKYLGESLQHPQHIMWGELWEKQCSSIVLSFSFKPMQIWFVTPLVVSAALGLALTFVIMRKRPATGSRLLSVLLVGCTLWTLGYAFEVICPDLESKLFWAKFQYFGITVVPLSFYIFSIQHLAVMGWSARRGNYPLVLWVVPVVTLILVWTNDSHQLIWQQIELQAIDTFHVLKVEHGVWFWVYWIFSYCLLLLAFLRAIGGAFTAFQYYRWQIRLILVASLFPWIGNLVYITGWNPIPYLDWTPFLFTISGTLFTVSLFRYRLVEILPIARQTVFTEQTDGLLVLDLQDCIVDLNLQAQQMIGKPFEAVLGKRLADVYPALAAWVEKAGYAGELHAELSLGEEPKRSFYDMHITPLQGYFLSPIGRLIVLHDITQNKLDQYRLEQARVQLEDTVAERTETLRLTVEQLQLELSKRTLAEIRFEKIVESGPNAIVLVDQDGTIILVNEKAEHLFGYSREELIGKNVVLLVPAHLHETAYKIFMRYAARPFEREIGFDMDLSGLRKDGSEFPIEVSFGPLKTESGYWVACDIRDVSERIRHDQEQKQMMEEIKQSREQLQALTFQLQRVRESERHQIATVLHDDIGQNLTGLNLNLQLIENQLNEVACPEEIRRRLEDSLSLVEATTRQVRDMMSSLHPPVLDEYGLVSALQWYCGSFSQRSGLAVQVWGEEFKPRLPQNVEIVLFRIVQEALNNVAKHAKAKRVTVSVEACEGFARLVVEDDGIGFDPDVISRRSEEPHWGILIMQQRAASINGDVEIDTAPQRGTRLIVHVRRG